MLYTCDGNSVGVLIYDEDDRLLMITRAHAPAGIAPVAGHVADEHPDWRHLDAAVAETAEEVGLTVHPQDLDRVYIQWHPNRCGADVAHPSGGHDWQVYLAKHWSGTPVPDENEAAGMAWYTPAQVQNLAERTLAYARGDIGEQEWQASPGLEPMWLDILSILPQPHNPHAGLFDTVVQTQDRDGVRAVRRLYGAPAQWPASGSLADGDDGLSYTDARGRRLSLDREELTVSEEGCTHRVQASVGLPDPGEEAALPLARVLLAAMGLEADYELAKKTS